MPMIDSCSGGVLAARKSRAEGFLLNTLILKVFETISLLDSASPFDDTNRLACFPGRPTPLYELLASGSHALTH